MTRSVFADTSALHALIVDGGYFHEGAVEVFEGSKAEDARLIATSYVLVETYALLIGASGAKRCVTCERGWRPCWTWSGSTVSRRSRPG